MIGSAKGRFLRRDSLVLAGWATGALVVGALAGSWVALDSHLTHEWAWEPGDVAVLRFVPFTLTALLGLGGLLLAYTIRHATGAWQNRHAVAIIAVMVGSHLVAVGRGPLNPLTAAILLLFGLWLLERLMNPHTPWAPSAFAALVVLFLGCVLLSTVGRHPEEVLQGAVSTIPKLVLALVLADLLEDQARVRLAVAALLWSSGVVALAGVLQVIIYYVWKVEYTLADVTTRYLSFGFEQHLRASGFARTPHQFVPPLAAASLIALYLCVSPAGRGRRLLLGFLQILLVAALALSVVRGSWLALLFGLCALPFIARPSRALHWIGLGGLALATSVATGLLPWLLGGVERISPVGFVDRRLLLKAGLEALAEHPWNGVGIENFGPFSPTLERYPVHNALVEVGSELGAPGLLVFLVLLLWVGLRLAWAMRAAQDPVLKAERGALLAGYVVLLVVIQSEPMGYSQFVWIYLALGEGAARVVLTPPAPVGETNAR